jgi:hypothetical protein
LNQLVWHLRHCVLLIQKCCCISMTLFASDRSICIGCRICRRMICAKNERNMQKGCRHYCMLPGMMSDIILWLVTSHVASWRRHHVTCRLCREIAWSSSRDLMFRAKNRVPHRTEPERLRCCRRTPKWSQNEQRPFHDKHPYSIWISDRSSRKDITSEKICESSR